MHLTTFADLGLRSLMILGDQPEGHLLTIGELAELINGSTHHVARVIAKLADMNIVESRRGRGGGVQLALAARNASVGQILRELEGPGEVVDCEGSQACPLARRDCALRHRLVAAKNAFFAELDGDTVGELIASTRPTNQRISASRSPGPQPLGMPTTD